MCIMDNHHRPLATESFSYSWLITPDEKPDNYPLTELEHLHDEIPHQIPSSSSIQSFNFDISSMLSSHHLSSSSCSPPSPFYMVHADQLFCNGLILPSSAIMTPPSPSSTNSGLSNKFSPSSYVSFDQTQITRRPVLLIKNKLWVNLMRRLVGCLSPGGGCTKVDDFSRTGHDVVIKTFSSSDDVLSDSDRSTSSSLTTSTILTVDATVGSSRGDHDESSILEAILYCKKSCGGEY